MSDMGWWLLSMTLCFVCVCRKCQGEIWFLSVLMVINGQLCTASCMYRMRKWVIYTLWITVNCVSKRYTRMNVPNGLVENILCINAWSVRFYGECVNPFQEFWWNVTKETPVRSFVVFFFNFGSHMSTISALNGAVPVCVCAQGVYMLWDDAHITTFHVVIAAVYLGNGVFVERRLRTKTLWSLQKTVVE
jgi:hypothetical protein